MGGYDCLMVEGAAEAAIIDVLLENHYLKISRDSLITDPAGNYYQDSLNDKKFVNTFLNHDFGGVPIHMHIVCDNPKRVSKIPKLSQEVTQISYYITREEIETVQLYAKPGLLQKFEIYKQKKGADKKPSTFLINEQGVTTVKKYQYVYDLWRNRADDLVKAIELTKQLMKKKKLLRGYLDRGYLADLLKTGK